MVEKNKPSKKNSWCYSATAGMELALVRVAPEAHKTLYAILDYLRDNSPHWLGSFQHSFAHAQQDLAATGSFELKFPADAITAAPAAR